LKTAREDIDRLSQQASLADTLQIEREALTKHLAELRNKLAKVQSEMEELNIDKASLSAQLEHMVPR
jgi:hypothetical protein